MKHKKNKNIIVIKIGESDVLIIKKKNTEILDKELFNKSPLNEILPKDKISDKDLQLFLSKRVPNKYKNKDIKGLIKVIKETKGVMLKDNISIQIL